MTALDPRSAAQTLQTHGYFRLARWMPESELQTWIHHITERIDALDAKTPPAGDRDTMETMLRRSARSNTIIRELVGDEMVVARAGHLLWQWPHVQRVLTDSPIAAIASAYLDQPCVVTCSVIRKAPGSVQSYSPHRDAFFLHPEPEHLLTVAIALDPANGKSGGLGVVPGSHKAKTTWRVTLRDGHWQQTERGRQPTVPGELVAQDLDVGEALLFDGRTWHGSGPNESARQRRLLVTQFTSAAASWPEDSWIRPANGRFPRVTELAGLADLAESAR